MFTDLQEIYGKNENPYCFHKIPQNKNSENGMRGQKIENSKKKLNITKKQESHIIINQNTSNIQ